MQFFSQETGLVHQHYQERDDHVPGYIYALLAVGYHGFLPGCYLRRVKIGLSRDPVSRLEQFHLNQPPCDLRLIRTIFVNDMATVEAKLHKQFMSSNVKLKRSREWFDLNRVQMWWLHRALDRYAAEYSGRTMVLPFGTILLGLAIALSIFAILSLDKSPLPQLTPPAVHSTIKPKVKTAF